MKTARILFLIARTHGFQSHLLKTQDTIRLLRTNGLKEMIERLLTTDYSTELTRIAATEPTALQLERMFQVSLSKRWYSMLQITSGHLGELLEVHNSKLEIENLKTIIRAIHGENRITDEQLYSIPRQYQEVNSPALLIANTMSEMVDLLRESPYREIEEHLEEYESSRNPIFLEMYLDNKYYRDLWAEIGKTAYAGEILALIGTEVDMRNLELIVASKYMRLEPRLVRESIIDLRFRLRKATISALISADLQEIPAIRVWQSYAQILQKAVELVNEDKIAEMQTLFSQYLYSYAEETSIRNPNDLVYVFSYLQLCVREARNLTALAIGKQTKLSEEKLKNLLFL
jgi:V/A-type H+-transporting ATPase subunit C